MDSEKAYSRISRMWWKLGTLFEKAALEAASRGSIDAAMKCGRMADACYFQSTGDGDANYVSDFKP